MQAYLAYAQSVSDGDLGVTECLVTRLNPDGDERDWYQGQEQDGVQSAVGDFISSLGYEPIVEQDGGAFASTSP